MRPLNVGRKPFGYRGATASHWVHGVCVFTFDESLVVQVSVSQFSIVARFQLRRLTDADEADALVRRAQLEVVAQRRGDDRLASAPHPLGRQHERAVV